MTKPALTITLRGAFRGFCEYFVDTAQVDGSRRTTHEAVVHDSGAELSLYVLVNQSRRGRALRAGERQDVRAAVQAFHDARMTNATGSERATPEPAPAPRPSLYRLPAALLAPGALLRAAGFQARPMAESLSRGFLAALARAGHLLGFLPPGMHRGASAGAAAVSTIPEALLRAYRWHRELRPSGYPLPADTCLAAARADVGAGKARYPREGIFPAVTWQPGKKGLAHVERPDHAGLRHVGDVEPESYGGRKCWSTRNHCGWYTDPDGMSARDGTGLLWGVVYQLPGRAGRARFVAGYQEGGCDVGPTLDLSEIFEGEAPGNAWDCSPRDCDAARDAARRADRLAERAAKEERDYQTAWRAGTDYAEAGEELADLRRDVLATIRDMRGACETIRALPVALRDRLRASIADQLDERAELHRKRASLVEAVCSWQKAAFNEGAGEVVVA